MKIIIQKELIQHPNNLFIPFEDTADHKGQSMYIWPGLILQSNATDSRPHKYNIKN
jgi:hypothetical protein